MVEEATFSPGPWKADPIGDSYEQRRVRTADSEQVAWVCNGSAIPGRTTANARLIAAAPALYEALRALKDDITSYSREAIANISEGGAYDTEQCVIAACRALAAAEGRGE